MKLFAAAAVAMAMLSGVACAQTSASASLTSYGFELVDLDLNDGITPSITFDNLRRGVEITAARYRGAEPVKYTRYADGESGVEISASAGQSAGYASYSPDRLFASNSMGPAGLVTSEAFLDADYTLSANTKLIFTGLSAASLVFGEPPGVPYYTIGNVKADLATQDDEYWDHDRNVTSLDPGVIRFEEWFTLERVNDSDLVQSSHLTVSVLALGVVSTAPEPSTGLMLAAGLALTAGLARRRRAAQAN